MCVGFYTLTQPPWAASFRYPVQINCTGIIKHDRLRRGTDERRVQRYANESVTKYQAVRRRLALLLLVLRVLADNHNLALTANDLALLADRLYRRSYLHVILPPSNFLVGWDTGNLSGDHWRAGHMRTSARFLSYLERQVIRPRVRS